jgi:site-specific DNA recombinase
MDTPNQKFFLYARKSTDDMKRQVRSIKDQCAEAQQLAKRESLVIVDTFIEHQTAKKPGRPIFNEMLDRIEKGEASGILAWHPDRLSRNSLDGGRVIWLVDTGKIKELKFPSFRFDPTPQGKLSLAIEFGISKYYVDKLSEDIKRGIRQKAQNGIWFQRAPLGYLNDPTTKTIVPDPERSPLVRKAFEMYATGNYTLRQVREAMNDLGLHGPSNGTLSPKNYQYILQNPIYYGMIRYEDQYYEGKHEAIIPKSLFNVCQQVMTQKSKPKSDKLKSYLYRGLFHCGECGRLITTETQKGHNYLRCTKWDIKCSQRYTREESIGDQVSAYLRRLALPAEWADWMLDETAKERASATELAEVQIAGFQTRIKEIDGKLDRLMTAYIERVLSLQEYGQAKNILMDEKRDVQEKLAAIEQSNASAFEPLIEFLKAAKQAGILAENEKPEEQRDFFKKATSNLTVRDRHLSATPREAWKLVVDQGSFAQRSTAAGLPAAAFVGETHLESRMRRGRDSNPRCGLSRIQHFQCCSFSHSDTSPELQPKPQGGQANIFWGFVTEEVRVREIRNPKLEIRKKSE